MKNNYKYVYEKMFELNRRLFPTKKQIQKYFCFKSLCYNYLCTLQWYMMINATAAIMMSTSINTINATVGFFEEEAFLFSK